MRDCFAKNLGRGVHADGSVSTACFARRRVGHSGGQTYAQLDTTALLKYMLRHLRSLESDVKSCLNEAGFQKGCVQAVTTEDLFAFEDSAVHIGRSLSAWELFFSELGVRLNTSIVLDVWQQEGSVGSRHPAPQSSYIYNYDEVVAAIEASGIPAMMGMLRG